MADAIQVTYDGEHADAIRAIREQVFIVEQQIDADIEFDGLDPQALHVLIRVRGQFVGTGRILADGHIGRIAILADFRSLGLGAKVVQALVVAAREQGYPHVYLGAQKHAVDFYVKLGFSAYGDEFIEADIVHLAMEQYL